MPVLYSSIAALGIMLASLSGTFFLGRYFSNILHRHLNLAVAFALGVFLVLTYSLIHEAFEIASSLVLWSGLIGGAVLLEIATLCVPHAHHHHGVTYAHRHKRIDAHRMLAGDALHNIGDGIILVPAFIVDVRIGIATAAALFLHEIVQEIAEFFVLKEAGYTTREAIIRNALVSATIFIGIALSLFATSLGNIETLLISISAGGFVYIITRDLIPSVVHGTKHSDKKLPVAFAVFLGIALALTIGFIVPHEEHGTDTPQDNHTEVVATL